MKRINVNDQVQFRLTKEGAEIVNRYYDPYRSLANVPTYNPGDIFKEQLWTVMQIFGPNMSMSNICPMFNCNIYIEDKYVEDVKSIKSAENKDWKNR